jgi:hypothetical protein
VGKHSREAGSITLLDEEMKKYAFLLIVLLISGCMTPVKVKDPLNLTTREIYAVLKHESINTVWTTHSNLVGIVLANGREYAGVYNPDDIPRFGKDPSLHPASAFVDYMRKRRLFTTWDLICE